MSAPCVRLIQADDYLAEVLATRQVVVGRARLGKREDAIDDRLDPRTLERTHEIFEHRDRADIDAVDADVLVEDGARIDRTLRAGENAENAHRSAVAQRLYALIECAGAAD